MRYLFGPFDFDPATGELYRAGDDGVRRSVRLRPQTGSVLAVLLAAHRQLVTRKTLQQQFWPEEPWVARQGLSACIAEIRAALGDRADDPLYVKTHPRRGYSFVAPVEVTSGAGESARTTESAAPPLSSARSSARVTLLRGGVVAVLAAAGLLLIARVGTRGPGPESTTGTVRVLVLPLLALGPDAPPDYVRAGITDMIIADLAGMDGLDVIGRRTSALLEGNTEPADVVTARVGANRLVDGTVTRSGGGWTLRLQVLDPATKVVLAANEHDLGGLPDAHTRAQIVRGLAPGLNIESSVAAAEDEPESNPPTDLARAEYLLDRPGSDPTTIRGLLDAALAADADEARTHAVRAVFFMRTGDLDAARAAALRTLALDSTVSVAHEVLAGLSMHDLELNDSGRHADAAVRHDPRSTTALTQRAYITLLGGNRVDAIRDVSRALELDPIVPQVQGDAGWVYYYARDWAQAREVCESRLRILPTSRTGLECVMLSATMQHDSVAAAMAAAALDSSVVGLPSSAGILRTYWENRLAETAVSDGQPPQPGIARARALSMLGRGAEAVAELKAATDNGPLAAFLFAGIDPRLDAARASEGWSDIAGRFPPE